jgi:hypothetical protein
VQKALRNGMMNALENLLLNVIGGGITQGIVKPNKVVKLGLTLIVLLNPSIVSLIEGTQVVVLLGWFITLVLSHG